MRVGGTIKKKHHDVHIVGGEENMCVCVSGEGRELQSKMYVKIGRFQHLQYILSHMLNIVHSKHCRLGKVRNLGHMTL